jgi:nucleotide-binding universal stress UspA family protein
MRILVATGGESHSDLAVRLGGIIQETTGGALTLLTVIRAETERSQAKAILSRAGTLIAATSEIETRIRSGQPAAEIVREAKAGSYDLLVVGERIQHGFIRRFLPPTAERVIAQMPCPVLIARGKPQPLRRLLVCESGREPTLLNRLISGLPSLLTAANELTVLHVMSQIAAAPGVRGWVLRADAEELIQEHTPEGSLFEGDIARSKELNINLKAKVRHGLVVQEIHNEARSGDYNLVAIGAHQVRGWKRYLLDDLAHEIIEETDRPLLVV